MQKIIKSNILEHDINDILSLTDYDKLFILTDTNTLKLCYSLISSIAQIRIASLITIAAGDENKNLETLSSIWTRLSDNGATRHSLLINLGGGMLTDIGGFAAATFKRGLKCINIPTTVLGAVDAAVGGKTGVNFNGLKNEVGAFAPADVVLIDSTFFKTLDKDNILSGFAEMLKHSLIHSNEAWKKLISFNLHDIDYDVLNDLVFDSVKVKEEIVKEDPFERGIRKALNLGHTIGHAFESLSHEKGTPIQHGLAVAWGLVCELYLSYKSTHFPKDKLQITISFIKDYYQGFIFGCEDYDTLYQYMKHDKKNEGDEINFTLLSDIGEIRINQTATKEDILESIDFLRDSLGI